ncbi:unnamed protein product [Amoebophrya sp. A25]|nr:unnamed protein product [Amoebophrya sp. A25]|eukprot:GSA25T00003747001.1
MLSQVVKHKIQFLQLAGAEARLQHAQQATASARSQLQQAQSPRGPPSPRGVGASQSPHSTVPQQGGPQQRQRPFGAAAAPQQGLPGQRPLGAAGAP